MQRKKKLIHLFDEAQENIYLLMINDSFPRFQRSDVYTQFLGKENSPRQDTTTSMYGDYGNENEQVLNLSFSRQLLNLSLSRSSPGKKQPPASPSSLQQQKWEVP